MLVRVAVGRARLAVLIRFSDMAAEQSGLNPIDYVVWRSYKSVCTTTSGSRTWKSCQRVEEEWDRPDQEVIDNAISEWRKRLTACAAAGRGHAERPRPNTNRVAAFWTCCSGFNVDIGSPASILLQ